jgi:hypothetical protein
LTADVAAQVGKTVDATSQALRRAKVSLSAALSAEPGLLDELRAGMPRPY